MCWLSNFFREAGNLKKFLAVLAVTTLWTFEKIPRATVSLQKLFKAYEMPHTQSILEGFLRKHIYNRVLFGGGVFSILNYFGKIVKAVSRSKHALLGVVKTLLCEQVTGGVASLISQFA